jgi:hypothetical protein
VDGGVLLAVVVRPICIADAFLSVLREGRRFRGQRTEEGELMYILRRPDGSEVNRAQKEEDAWSPLWPSIPWPGMDPERVMKWVKETHLGLGWTVEETKED